MLIGNASGQWNHWYKDSLSNALPTIEKACVFFQNTSVLALEKGGNHNLYLLEENLTPSEMKWKLRQSNFPLKDFKGQETNHFCVGILHDSLIYSNNSFYSYVNISTNMPSNFTPTAISLVSSGIYVGGNNGDIYKVSPYGGGWSLFTSNIWAPIKSMSQKLDLVLTTNNKLYQVSLNGNCTSISNLPGTVTSYSRDQNGKIWIVTDSIQISYTDDNGQNWSSPSLTGNFIDIKMLPDMLVAIGDNGKIYSSIDNGLHWILDDSNIQSPPTFITEPIYFTYERPGLFIFTNDGSYIKNHHVYELDEKRVFDLENSTWAFGKNAGIKFSSHSKPKNFFIPQQDANGPTCSVSDTAGNLIWFSNSRHVKDSLGNTIINGSDLFGQFCKTEDQNIAIRAPNSNELYYLFYNSVYPIYGFDVAGFYYSTISTSDSLKVLQKNVKLFDNASPMITATYHKNGKDIWVFGQKYNTNKIFVYLLSCSGIELIHTHDIPITISSYKYTGDMEVNPKGDKFFLACSDNDDDFLIICDFDNETGEFSDKRVYSDLSYGAPEIQFSPNGKYLFILDAFRLNRVDIESLETGQPIINYTYVNTVTHGLELGPDGSLYLSDSYDSNIYVISNPNFNMIVDSISIDYGEPAGGFPQTIQNHHNREKIVISNNYCPSSILKFELLDINYPIQIDSVKWWFPDDNSTYSTFIVNKSFPNGGSKTVQAIRYYNFISDTISATFEIKDIFNHYTTINNAQIYVNGEIYYSNEVPIPEIEGYLTYLKYANNTHNDFGIINDTLIAENCYCYEEIPYSSYVLDFFIPNVFTPNLDGVNELYLPKFPDVKINWELRIFNRWGTPIFQTNSTRPIAWDGYSAGKKLSPGTYFYKLRLLDTDIPDIDGSIQLFW